MARVLLPVAGAVIGFFVGGGAVGAQYGWLAGSIVAGVVGTQTRRSVRVNETGAQTTTEGSPRAIIYGAAPVTGNLIDTGPIRVVETTEEAKGGGGPSATSRSYFRTYAIRICEGPVGALLVAKRDGKVVWDVRPGSNFAADNAAFLAYINFYNGDETQLPAPSLEAIHGVGNVPAHRGSCYIVFNDDDLTTRQGSVPQWEFVVAQEATADVINLTTVTFRSIEGVSGGGLLTTGTVNTTFDTVGDGGITGSAFLAYLGFYSYLSPISAQFSVTVHGALVWSELVTATVPGPKFWRVQLNHQLDSTSVVLHFNTDSGVIGSVQMALIGLPGADPYAPLQPAGVGETIVVEADNPTFGVVVNGAGTYGRASAVIPDLAAEIWRVSTTYDLGTYSPEPAILGDIVEDVHSRCNASVPDVTELTDEVAGLVFGSADYSGADAIETLRTPYLFDRSEYDGQVHYPKRGADAVATIDFDDLVEVPDESQRESHPEYPRKLHLGFQSLQVNYEVAQASSDRYSPDARVIGEQTLQVPVVLDEEQAANLVARLHKIAWADAEGEVKFSLPMQWIGLTASECIDLDLRNRVRRLRIEKIEDSEGVRALTCRIDRQTAYSSEAPSFVPLPTPPAPPSTIPGDTVLAVLDIAALRDVDDVLQNYFAVSSDANGWRGAQVQRSLDDGASFTAAQTITSAAVIGMLVEAVPEASEHYTDTTNLVRVELIRDGQSLTSISDLAFEQYGGAFALEKVDGSWEIMQYLDAALDSDNAYVLSTLHRGLGNSGAAAHAIGAKFVLLTGVRVQPTESTWLNTDLVHRAPSIGQSPEDADEQTLTYAGRSQTEWPVTALELERDGSDIVTATWVPRHRLGSDVAPIASINFQGYRVTLDDGVDEVTFDTTTAGFTYDASALSSDPINVTVQSINRFTGVGPATTDSI